MAGLRKTPFCPKKTWKIFGGLACTGLELCQRITERWAKGVIRTLPSGPKSAASSLRLSHELLPIASLLWRQTKQLPHTDYSRDVYSEEKEDKCSTTLQNGTSKPSTRKTVFLTNNAPIGSARTETVNPQRLVPRHTVVKLNESSSGIPVFVLHPIYGFVQMLEPLAKLLTSPVYGLQCTAEAPLTSTEDLAFWYLKQIQSLNVGTSIHLCGYSFGALLSSEMTLQTENNRDIDLKVAKLIMLEGSPALVKSSAQSKGDVHLLCAFAAWIRQINTRELRRELLKLSSPEQRINFVTDLVTSQPPYLTREEVANFCDLASKRHYIAKKYTMKQKINKDVVLIKSAESLNITDTLSEQYGLEEVCCGNIEVHTVGGDHNSFIQGRSGEEVARIINSVTGRCEM